MRSSIRESDRSFIYREGPSPAFSTVLLEAKRLPKGRRTIYRRYQQNLLPKVKPLLKYFKKTGKGWAQKSVYERAKEIRGGLAYQELYWIFCAHKHTLPMSVIGTTETTKTGLTRVIAEPHMKGVCDAVDQSASLLLQICTVIDKVFGLTYRSEIDSGLRRLSDAVESTRRSHPTMYE